MPNSLEQWKGKIAIITGASSGIGAAIAGQLVEQGLIVVGLARRAELIEKRSKELQDKEGKLYAIKTDVTKESEMLDAFQWVSENLGPVSVLVNSAGILICDTLVDGNTNDWKQMFDVNVLSLWHIIHISGISGHYVPNIPQLNVLPAVKHSITALTETLRQELNSIKSKIKISCIAPGLVDTPMAGPVIKSANLPSLKADDVAESVLSTPPHVQVHEIIIRPIGESF